MILFPAIDIRGGKCVRLTQGDYNQEKVYSDAPEKMAQAWQKKGAKFLHVVDLDGAKTGDSMNQSVIKSIAELVNIPVQVGGGIRSIEVIEKYITAGVNRVIIGTAAINHKEFLNEAVSTYGDRIAVSIDARNGFVATDGWTKASNIKATNLVKELESIGVKTIVYTDILKDGMLKGPNFEELQTINEITTMDVIASGGVSTKEDIQRLGDLNMYGAIIGKALYDGTLKFEEALEANSSVS
ncbi:1-(5-phosphoribosyl)-5-[(5-phosphoribosylamino)methylideneamino]imidazole-4-carboxamide isomerase [Oceanobacillus caeni]|uniref:1-(5-phosphoribosyl)-5-[(5-phosphoribosylamino)methylideneamino] imidazole-4-carboxamide isomerase n=1 Tax=Oceanobacillus caeni TaxID=405946 RepID=A0ABR5MM85_9BACI|nr:MULTISPECIES: 1-(5-phosphoribosyl)-5-[(5-phosphoribosylamino)methylideneamino]imidazole-4-carboxamide isomerase [Bacillaceae]KKE79480.1 1-(5-phosphoribosyl)-5-[(5-phosphoribosylamino)methylideneamino] imidazole-4-carboxamide isomerase [Bacilli bacterium VT-13-104]PZD83667.1 1-(5-phosphoribosyl)-5-[(5-phosphoribosylamino)methylideneamino]imidazole-4-carboxamide isomerase [Bacilli bacterium]KPH77591.1 1-(5-phosphoribosyl)-5-[(5-phosphoribosylamino)methylideneamino] imidazole-4-carboxamide isome